MLQLGVRGHDMPVAPFDEWAKSIKDEGFCCTQLALKKAVHDFDVSDGAMTSGMALYMRRILDKYGVNVSVLGCYKNLADPDEASLCKTIESYKNHIRFASYLGAGLVGTETGAVNHEYKPCAENHTEKALSIFTENLKKVVEYAECMGVCVGIEPVYKHIMFDIEQTRKVLDRVKSPNLRIILDPVNLLCAENESRHNEIVDGAFELFGDEIDVIHLKDYVIADGEIKSRPVTFGEGRFDFAHLFKILKEKKPCINMLIEDSLLENRQISKQYICDIYKNC
ncbi:MAG: sugar phosphate isomerase/epimerase [Lachnospiraceae bacterium]|nr:sugar phosphate isomerase/epimerase [Lachnospiraceae bacterium]